MLDRNTWNHLTVDKRMSSSLLKMYLQNKFRNHIYLIYTGWNDKIVVLKKTTLQLYFKTFIEKINSGNLIM